MSSINPTPTVEILHSGRAELGEGPFYEQETDTLLWVDIDNKRINFLDPTTGNNKFLQFSDQVSAVIPVEGSSNLVALLGRKICLVDRSSGNVIEVLGAVEEDKPENRFNDAKCDSSGRLWCGTLGSVDINKAEKGGAALYSYSKGVLKKQVDAILSNGLGWSPADDVLYYIDTFALKIYTFAYDPQEGSISNQETFVDFGAQADNTVWPDGMCTDAEGRLWVASFADGRIRCFDPKTKEELLVVKLPGVQKVTSCCFGGPNYEWLFVTSAAIGSSEQELEKCPNAGAVFVIKDLGVKGTPAHKFKAA